MAVKKETAAAQTAAEAAQTPETGKPKTVKIKLFKDNGRYKSDVFVGVNGENYLIKRGVTVEVPEAVAEVLQHSEEMENAVVERIAQAEAAAAAAQA